MIFMQHENHAHSPIHPCRSYRLHPAARGGGTLLRRAGPARGPRDLLHELEVRPPGQFHLARAGGPERQPKPSGNVGAWLKGDGSRPAVFETTDMPRGIRLVAQPAEKVPFKHGQLAAQVFDEGKYKAWYVVDPCSEPEPYSSKDKILPGHNGHVAYAESADGVNWTHPNLGLYEYAGSRSNNIVWRGDLDGSTRGFHGGSVFVDPSSTDERFKMVYLGLITDAEWAAFEKKYPGEADTMARRPDVGGFRCVFGVLWRGVARRAALEVAARAADDSARRHA